MPEYLSPGVYVEETSFRSKSIEGVSTSTTAFVGPTLRGPVADNPDKPKDKDGFLSPEVITSYGEFERVFGGMDNLTFGTAGVTTNYMAHAVKAFFDNGGSRLYVARVYSEPTGETGRAETDPILGAAAASDDDKTWFRARFPGAAYNGKIVVRLSTSQAGEKPLDEAPNGSLIQLGSNTPAGSAELDGGKAPFALSDGDKLGLTIDNNGTDESREVTFEGKAATAQGNDINLDADKVKLDNDATLNVNFTDIAASEQEATVVAGEYTPYQLAVEINSKITGGSVNVEVDGAKAKLSLTSDTRGKSSKAQVKANAELGFAADVNSVGSGNVSDLDAVTLTEINTILTDGGVKASVVSPDDSTSLQLASTATGENVKMNVATAPSALGLPDSTQVATGKTGSAVTYRVKENDKWRRSTDDDTKATADLGTELDSCYLITASVTFVDPDNSEFVLEDLGLAPSHPRWMGSVFAEHPSRKADRMTNPVYMEVGTTLKADKNLVFKLQQAFLSTESTKTYEMENGSDGLMPGSTHYDTGLLLLKSIEDISIIAAPGHSEHPSAAQAIQGSLIKHAENMRYRIAVLDSGKAKTPGEAQEERSKIDSKYAAYYYPWVVVNNPLARPGNDQVPKEIALPPSGFVCGVYARTDISRGVWKAPANEVVRGALRFESEINKGQQDILNPMGINCLRFFFGRGYRVWGARTVSSDPEWKYVNVRRYFIYLERSIDRSTQWVVFEPNGERLWANVRETVSNFLYTEWRNGALMGSTPEEAFFVRCDRSTMTQNDLDNGRMICEIGVAVLYPAEFVIFRIGQKTADARS